VDRNGGDVLSHFLYVQSQHQLFGTDTNWGLCWPSLAHGMIWRRLHQQSLRDWSSLAEQWCNFSQMRSKNYSITILGQCWHSVGHGLFHATVMSALRWVRFPCETPTLHSLNESRWAPELLTAYHECARHSATRFAELWCANGIGHDASQYIAFDSHHYCIHVTSFAASVSCFRFFFYSVAKLMSTHPMLSCHAFLQVGRVPTCGCIFAAASVSREMSSMGLSDCFEAIDDTQLQRAPNALAACAAGLQIDCTHHPDDASSCRPMVWDILVTSHRIQISTLAQYESALDPQPWPMLAASM